MSRATETRPAWRQQGGFALLVTLLVLVVGAATVFVSASQPAADQGPRAPERSRSLADAHDAVLAYAQFGGSNNKPGALPCPDTRDPGDPTEAPDMGQTGNHCQGSPDPVYLGRLPWRTVDLSRQSSERWIDVWYAIDGDFQDDPDDPPELNAETSADLVVLGTDPTGDGVARAAVLILPGAPLQDQPSRPSPDPAAYLEGENANGDSVFQDCAGVSDCNDRVIGMRADVLFDRIQRYVLAGVERALGNAHDRLGSLPYAAGFGGSVPACESDRLRGRLPRSAGDCAGAEPYIRDDDFESGDEWIYENDWPRLIVYEVDPDCSPGGGSCGTGTLQLNDDGGFDAVIAGAGRAHDDQSRPGTDVSDFLDSPDNRADDGVYRDHALSAADNDVFRAISVGP